MNIKGSRSRLMVLSLLGIVLLLVLRVVFWSGSAKRSASRSGDDHQVKLAPQSGQTNPSVGFNHSPLATGTAAGSRAAANSRLVDQGTALASLKHWIKQREGQDVD